MNSWKSRSVPTLTRVTRIAIVNRGESAMRLIHAVRDLNARRAFAGSGDDRADGQEPVRTIALYTDSDAGAAFVREADETYLLGAAADRPYLDLARLEEALRATGADAAWVGWGFVAEDPAFAELCERIGVTFVGPSAAAMRQLGDKIGSKLIAEEAGVPVAAWSRGPVDTLTDALAAAERIGFPLMLKATAGGGGRGIRKVERPEDLIEAFERTRDEAQRAFGSGVVFLEKLVSGARHVEVQLIADGQGTAWAVGVRDCSVQRRNQKVIEESASALLGPEQTDELKASAERLALAVGYAGAATVEFLYHPPSGAFAFLEVNTRLQVEHPVTELVTGLDLVALQLQVAAGRPLTGSRPAERGHAVEARLNAEDPDRAFAPSPGRITRLELPAGPGVRVDTGVAEGDTIPADFDSMIAKIIAYGADRDEALARLRRAMLETTVVIAGGATNKSFVLELLADPAVTRGEPAWADTGWIDRTMAAGGLVADRYAGVALVAAAIETYAESEQAEISRFLTTARGGRPQLQHETDRRIELKLRGVGYHVQVARIGADRHRVVVSPATAGDPGAPQAGSAVTAWLDRIDAVHGRLRIGSEHYRLVTAGHGPTRLVEVNGVAHRISRDEGGMLRSPTPALVVATPVALGAEVSAGDPVIVLESMKMETVLSAPVNGRLKELMVRTGSQVNAGEPLARLEPTGDQPAGAEDSAAVSIELPADPSAELDAEALEPAELARLALRLLHDQLLGYDISAEETAEALEAYLGARDALAGTGVDVFAEETALVGLFTDFAELTRNRPADEERQTELRVHSSREYFHTYLGTLDPARGGLPEHFLDKLLRVLAAYGVDDLESPPTDGNPAGSGSAPGRPAGSAPALHEALFRIFLAQRSSAHLDVVVGLLQQWLRRPAPAEGVALTVRALLERMVRATQLRFPVIGDLARSVRFAWFDQPIVDRERTQVLDGIADEVAALADPEAVDRDTRIEALTEIPEQLVGFVADRMNAQPAGQVTPSEPLLEVLIRRHYREFDLHGLSAEQVDGRPVVRADYVSEEHGPTRVISTLATIEELGAASPGSGAEGARSLSELLRAEQPAGGQSVIELYVRAPRRDVGADELSAELMAMLSGQPFALTARRTSVAMCSDPADGADGTPVDKGSDEVSYFTFRPAATGADAAGVGEAGGTDGESCRWRLRLAAGCR